MTTAGTKTAAILRGSDQSLLDDWNKNLKAGLAGSQNAVSTEDLASQAGHFLDALRGASQSGLPQLMSPAAQPMREFLESVSRSRAVQGFTSAQTAGFILSLKKPLFDRLRADIKDVQELADETWAASQLIDELGMFTVTTFQKSREDLIRRQQEEMLELSTPVVKLWDGVLALPMIGTLDSARTQIVMEALLQQIVESGAEIAIIDITGVPTVDTLVAQHLLKTVTAIRLMGADCIISGIRPQIAQTIVHLGIDLEGITTKATLADALMLAFRKSGLAVTKRV